MVCSNIEEINYIYIHVAIKVSNSPPVENIKKNIECFSRDIQCSWGVFQLESCEEIPALYRSHYAKNSRKVCLSIRPFRSQLVCSVSIWHIGMYLHGFQEHILPDINKRSSLGERWEQAEA